MAVATVATVAAKARAGGGREEVATGTVVKVAEETAREVLVKVEQAVEQRVVEPTGAVP